jgi:hypothetical protein
MRASFEQETLTANERIQIRQKQLRFVRGLPARAANRIQQRFDVSAVYAEQK